MQVRTGNPGIHGPMVDDRLSSCAKFEFLKVFSPSPLFSVQAKWRIIKALSPTDKI